MDRNANSFDALYAATGDHHPLMPWDKLLTFVRRFPQLDAFDAALNAQQRPEVTSVETEEEWLQRFDRRLEAEATAHVVPHPFARAEPPTWDGVRTIVSALRKKELMPVTMPATQSPTVMLIHLLRTLSVVYAGHRGARPELGIAAGEPDLDSTQVQFESECITWLVAGRIGLRMASHGLLKGYLKHDELIPEFSRDRVLHAVNGVEELFGGALAFGETVRADLPSLFTLSDQLMV